MSAERQEKLLGPYHVERRLASGGMAEVFVAQRQGIHGFSKRVALKRILPQFGQDPDFVWMFIDEARLAARLEHPNIVQVFDFGKMGDDLVLVMELVDGVSLTRLIRACGSDYELPWEAVVHIGHQTASALEYAHEAIDERGLPLGFVHRDVSPGNVLLTRTGHIKLTDFGIALVRSRTPTTENGQVRGKLGYMSPEQVLGAELTGKSDIFTLSAVMAELLLGHRLFEGESDIQTLMKIRDAEISALTDSPREIPRALRHVLACGLQREPEARPSARAFAEACFQLMHTRGVTNGADRLATVLEDLALVETPRRSRVNSQSNIPLTGLTDPALQPEHTVPRVAPEHPVPTPHKSGVMYRAVLSNGTTSPPVSFQELVELLTTGKITGDASVARNDAVPCAARELPELSRFVDSRALQWDADEAAMASLSGDLVPGTLLRVIVELLRRRATGVLHMQQRERRKKIYVIDGRPDFVASNDRSELFGEYLVANEVCSRIEVDIALAALPQYEGRLGDALVDLGILRPMQLMRALGAQVELRLREAFSWSHGTWAYVDGVRSNEDGCPLRLDTPELIHSLVDATSIALIDEAIEPIADDAVMLVPQIANGHSMLLRDRWSRVLHTIEPGDTIASVIARWSVPDLPNDDVKRAIYIGLVCDVIRPRLASSFYPAFGE